MSETEKQIERVLCDRKKRIQRLKRICMITGIEVYGE